MTTIFPHVHPDPEFDHCVEGVGEGEQKTPFRLQANVRFDRKVLVKCLRCEQPARVSDVVLPLETVRGDAMGAGEVEHELPLTGFVVQGHFHGS